MRYSRCYWEDVNSQTSVRQENVDAGAARGWQVILQTEEVQSCAAVKRLGLFG